MNQSKPRQPFITSPSLRRLLQDAIPDEKPESSTPRPRRLALGEVKNDATKRDAPESTRRKSSRRRKSRLYFDVHQDRPPEPAGPATPAERPKPPLPALPPTALTAALLAHATPKPELPSLPSPPPAKPRRKPLAAAQSLAPPPAASLPSSSPGHLLRQLRQSLEEMQLPPKAASAPTIAPAPPKAISTPSVAPPPPPPPPSRPQKSEPNFAHVHTISLLDLPPLTHHSEHAIVALCPPTHLKLTIRGNPARYTITPSSMIVDGVAYAIEDIPWKHLPAYRFARRFVAAVRKRTLIAYGGVEGAQGRLWADGRALITFGDGGVEVEIPPPGQGKAVIRGVARKERAVVEAEAREIYKWLQTHPKPNYTADPDKLPEWELTPETRFVKGVGWCRELGEGQWSMRFLDGVRLEIRGSEVLWVEPDGVQKWIVKAGLKDKDVRRRAGLFVKAGL